jgi:hypothetical protein
VSQYPYQPPHVPYGYGYSYQNPRDALRAPAKRASIFLFILAGLFIPCGGLTFFYSLMINSPHLPPEVVAQFKAAQDKLAPLGWTLSGVLQTIAIGAAVPGIIFVVLGVILRKGGMGSSIFSIIVSILLCLIFGYFTLGGLAVSAQGQTEGLFMGCVMGVPLVLSVCLLVFSIQAARNAGRLAALPNNLPQQYQQQPPFYQPPTPSQQPQNWQQPGPGQWGQPNWPPQQQPPQEQQQNWPPPPSNPT